MSIYIAQIIEGNGGQSFTLTRESSLEEVAKGFGSDVSVRAIYNIGPLTDQEHQMINVLLGIDSTTNTNVVGDLLARIFGAGVRVVS